MSEPIVYTLTISARDITLSGDDGTTSVIDLPVDSEGENTTYSLSCVGNILTLTGSDSDVDEVSIPVIEYSLSFSNNVLTLIGSDNSISRVPIVSSDSDGANAVYTIGISGRVITLTPSGGTPQDITLPADNNTTYGLYIEGTELSLVEGGNDLEVEVHNDNTTYDL